VFGLPVISFHVIRSSGCIAAVVQPRGGRGATATNSFAWVWHRASPWALKRPACADWSTSTTTFSGAA